MKNIYKYNIFILLIVTYISCFSSTGPAFSAIPIEQNNADKTYAIDYSIKKAIDIAEKKRQEAHVKEKVLDDYFQQGKRAFQAASYNEARQYFEQVLAIDPAYEPAKLYLESSIIYQNVLNEQEEINNIKIKMADIISEYDRRRDLVDSLTVKYFLEQAQEKCQLGDFKAAEDYYNICYKINPYSQDKIEWFVKATYDLIELYRSLDEHNRKIEELAVAVQ